MVDKQCSIFVGIETTKALRPLDSGTILAASPPHLNNNIISSPNLHSPDLSQLANDREENTTNAIAKTQVSKIEVVPPTHCAARSSLIFMKCMHLMWSFGIMAYTRNLQMFTLSLPDLYAWSKFLTFCTSILLTNQTCIDLP
jgi:hypothetical protein